MAANSHMLRILSNIGGSEGSVIVVEDQGSHPVDLRYRTGVVRRGERMDGLAVKEMRVLGNEKWPKSRKVDASREWRYVE